MNCNLNVTLSYLYIGEGDANDDASSGNVVGGHVLGAEEMEVCYNAVVPTKTNVFPQSIMP